MLNEKNSGQPWKLKLEDAEFLSAETRLNKEVAWQKLQHRLHKPKRKKAIVYWAVAACLLPLLVVLLWILQQNKNNAEQVFIYQPTTTKPLLKQTAPNQTHKIIVVKQTNIERKKTAIKKTASSNLIVDTNRETEPIKNEDSVGNNKEMTADVANDSLATTPTVRVVKTKLKVVHINELGEPLEAAPVVVRNNYTHLFSMQIGKEELFATPIKVKNKTGFISLPGKSSSN